MGRTDSHVKVHLLGLKFDDYFQLLIPAEMREVKREPSHFSAKVAIFQSIVNFHLK